MITETSTYVDRSNVKYLDKKKILQQFHRFHTTVVENFTEGITPTDS